MKGARKKKSLSINKLLKVYSLPDTWFRLEHVSKISNKLEITFGIYQGQRGKKLDTWKVLCREVYEAKITELDGGGIRLYRTHPATRQYTARQASLSWDGGDTSNDEVIGAVYQAHTREVDDWIPFDRYIKNKSKKTVWQGPIFLLQAYAKALQAMGLKTTIKVLAKRNAKLALKVLHFGESYIVAADFKAQHLGLADCTVEQILTE